MTVQIRLIVLLSALAVAAVAAAPPARAQSDLRFGVGFNTAFSTAQGVGIGFRGRVAAPVNEDLSFAFGTGFTGFVLGGREDADYLLDPQVSLILTIDSPAPGQATYVLGGFGGHLPLGHDEDRRGPTIHAGIGWVRGLYASRLFYEVDPALVIGKTRVDVVVPIRVGVIF